MSRDTISQDDLRAALRADSSSGFRPVDTDAILRQGHHRRRTRRAALAGGALLVAAAVGAVGMWGPLGSTSANVAPTSEADTGHEDALTTLATCLWSSSIPDVVVTGPTGTADGGIEYLDEASRPLSTSQLKQNDEFMSAMEWCARQVPTLLPELETRWGDLHSWLDRLDAYEAGYNMCLADHGLTMPARPPASASDEEQARIGDEMKAVQAEGERAGCIFSPPDRDADKILQCDAGEQQSGIRPDQLTPPLAGSARDAAESWVTRQQDPARFATVTLDAGMSGNAVAHVLSRDGRTTGIVYLLEQPQQRWRAQSSNVCE